MQNSFPTIFASRQMYLILFYSFLIFISLIEKYIELNVIQNPKVCPYCNNRFHILDINQINFDIHYITICPICKKRQSIKTGRFLYKMRISLNLFEIIIFGLMENLTAENIFDIWKSCTYTYHNYAKLSNTFFV